MGSLGMEREGAEQYSGEMDSYVVDTARSNLYGKLIAYSQRSSTFFEPPKLHSTNRTNDSKKSRRRSNLECRASNRSSRLHVLVPYNPSGWPCSSALRSRRHINLRKARTKCRSVIEPSPSKHNTIKTRNSRLC